MAGCLATEQLHVMSVTSIRCALPHRDVCGIQYQTSQDCKNYFENLHGPMLWPAPTSDF